MAEHTFRILRAKAASQHSGLGVTKLYRMAAAGEIGCVRSDDGRLIGFTVGQLDAWVQQHSTPERKAADATPRTEPAIFDGERVFD